MKVAMKMKMYLKGEDAAHEQQHSEDQARVVGRHDVLFVGERTRLGDAHGSIQSQVSPERTTTTQRGRRKKSRWLSARL